MLEKPREDYPFNTSLAVVWMLNELGGERRKLQAEYGELAKELEEEGFDCQELKEWSMR
jgi:hypothetical protein